MGTLAILRFHQDHGNTQRLRALRPGTHPGTAPGTALHPARITAKSPHAHSLEINADRRAHCRPDRHLHDHKHPRTQHPADRVLLRRGRSDCDLRRRIRRRKTETAKPMPRVRQVIWVAIASALALLAGLFLGRRSAPPPSDTVDARKAAGDKALHDAQLAANKTRDPSALDERVRQLRERAKRGK